MKTVHYLRRVSQEFNPFTQEAEAGRARSVQGQFGLHNEFQSRKSYTVKPCLKQTNNPKSPELPSQDKNK